ncbi:MAG: MBOAT family protein [Lachnospiraceae bacterium]|nr:MBOAT family protein [Lachnospiraceae bacterium]
MTLNSIYFLPFMAGVLAVLFLVQILGTKVFKKESYPVAQKIIMLLCSFAFVACSSPWYLCILLGTIFFVYVWGRILEKKQKKGLLALGITVLVGELAYFKYTNFLIETLAACFKKDFVMLHILLPIGISFYIFTSIGYLVDVYRGEEKAEKNFVHLSLMICLFTKVLSGPIVRTKQFLPQMRSYRGLSSEGVLQGLQMFFVGLFKKIVLADHLSVFTDDVFFAPSAYGTGTMWLAVFSYALQIYFDFAGYSDMAIGATKMLGISLDANFNLPYVSKSPSEFWNRWHISLSAWLRDYLYIPLGGSRKGAWRVYGNLFLVMLISGLWHGAGLTFLVWGALHGLYSCLYKAVDMLSGRKLSRTKNGFLRVLLTGVNFFIVSLLWVFFRASSLPNALAVLQGCFSLQTGICQPYTWSFFAVLVLGIATMVACVRSRKKAESTLQGFCPCFDLRKMSSQILFFTFVGITMILGYFGNTAFIYGAF